MGENVAEDRRSELRRRAEKAIRDSADRGENTSVPVKDKVEQHFVDTVLWEVMGRVHVSVEG